MLAPAPRAPVTATAVTGAGWLATGAVVSKTAQTVVLLAFAAVLAPDAFGVISLAAIALNVTTVLADLGTGTALVHFRGDAQRAARTAVTIALTVSGALVLLTWTAAPWLAHHLQAGALGTDVLRGVVLCVPLAAVAGVSGELLRRALEFRRRVVPDIGGNVVGAGVTIGALAAGEGVFALVYGQLAQASVVLLLYRCVRGPVRPGWSRSDAAALVSYGAGLAGSGLLTLVVLNVGHVLIAHRLGVHEVGIYSMAFRLAYMPYLLIAMVIGGAVLAHLCRMRGATVGRAAADAAVRVHVLAVPAYVGMIVLAPQLRLLGEQWAPAVPALRWLAGYGLVLCGLELLLVALKSVGRTPEVLGLSALHLGVVVVLLLLYVERGVVAAAVAQFVAGAVTLLAAGAVVSRRVPGTEWSDLARRLAPVAVAAGALTLTAVTLQRVLPWGEVSATGLVVVGTCCVAAYTSTLLALGRVERTALAPRFSWRPAGLYSAVLALGLGAGALAVAAPYAVLVALVAAAVVAAACYRVEWTAVAFVAAEPFGDLLRETHPDAIKVMGALLFLSWLVRLVRDPTPVGLRHPGGYAVGALLAAVLASFVVHGSDLATAQDHLVGYVSYALVVVVLVDTVRRARPDPAAFARRLGLAFLISCTAAGAVAVAGFLDEGGRAAGPLADPNDLAFFMIAALPFALLVAGRSGVTGWRPSTRGAALAAACVAVLVVATFATLSRGALLGLAVMVVVALLLGAVRPVTALGVGAAAAAVLALLWVSHADVVGRSIEEKEHVAATNVELRVTTATVAAAMTADSPLLGQGPGGFEANLPQFAPAGSTGVQQTVAHQMYLDVSAELGLLGLGAFAAVLVSGARGALRARSVPDRRRTADAVLVALAGTLVSACFLSEQFYLPIWLLVALGIALDPTPADRLGRS